MNEYNLKDPDEIRKMLREIEAEGVRLMNEAEAEHLQKILEHPIQTDEDYKNLAELTDME